MKTTKPLFKQLHESQETVKLLTESLQEANKQNFQLLQDKVKLEGEIVNLKDRLSKYENINKKNNNC